MNKITRIEALRGFVAIYVTFAHVFHDRSYALAEYNFIWNFGDLGVAIFFVISGFVIQLSYERSKDKSFKSYFFKRFFRIYIPLILVFIANYFVQLMEFGVEGFTLPRLITNLLMLQNTNQPDSIFAPLFNNGPLWSLAYEWWYYMIFFFIINKIKDKTKTSAIIYSLGIISSILYQFYPVFIVQLLIDMVIWWFGVDLARLYLSNKKISFVNLKYPLLVLLACVLIITFTEPTEGKEFLFNTHLWRGLLAIIIGLLWYKANWKFFNKTIGLFLPFASISYVIYISHWFLVHEATFLHFLFGRSRLVYLVYFVICLIFSYLVEKIIYPKLNTFFMGKIFPVKK